MAECHRRDVRIQGAQQLLALRIIQLRDNGL